MKKFYFLVFAAAFVLMLIPAQSQAMDVSLGINTWYSWWDFNAENDDQEMEVDPAFLYGPLISLKFTDEWSLSSVFLYGTFDAKEQEYAPDYIDRFDSDTSINYLVNRYIKIFGGFKYMGFSWEDEYSEGSHTGYGPGIGIALTAPLADTLFLLFNISGLYIWAEEEMGPGYNNDAIETGVNSTISLAYYFPEISTSLMLGFRTQYIKIDYEKEGDHSSDTKMLFYGVTLSAVYSFEI